MNFSSSLVEVRWWHNPCQLLSYFKWDQETSRRSASKMRSKNVPLSWLCENITKCDTVAKGTRMFMLLFIGTFLCVDLGSTMNLCYLWSLRNIEQTKNYDWSGMAYATLLHFMTQLSRCSLSSLGGAPFVWQVGLGIFWVCMGFGKLFWLYVVMVLWKFFLSGLDVWIL